MGAGGSVAKLALSPDGTTVASSAHMPGTLLLRDLRGRKEPVELDTRGSHGSNSIAFSPDGKMLALSVGRVEVHHRALGYCEREAARVRWRAPLRRWA